MCRFQHWSCLAPVSLSLSRVSGRWLIAGSTIGAGGCLLSTFIFWHAILDNACDSWFPFISDVGDMNGVSEQAKVYYLFSWLMTVFSVLLFFSMWVVFCTVGERIRTAPPNSFASCCGCGCRWVDVFFQICNYIALMAALAGCSFLGLLVNICTTCSCELHAAATGVFFIGVLVACAIWTVLCLIIPKFRPSTNGCTRYCQLFYVCKPQVPETLGFVRMEAYLENLGSLWRSAKAQLQVWGTTKPHRRISSQMHTPTPISSLLILTLDPRREDCKHEFPEEFTTIPKCSKCHTNRFRKTKLIGGGSFGRVYMATDLVDGRVYALKEIWVTDPYVLEKSLQEGAIMSTLAHEYVLKCHHMFVGGLPGGVNLYRVCLILDYYRFGDLSKLIPQGLDEERIDRLLLEAAEGLDFLHSHQLIHRDIKPQNILIGSNGAAILADFGIAKLQTTGGQMTIVGSRAYMAPEQQSPTYDHMVDLWALGCVLFEMCTGEVAYLKKYDACLVSNLFYRELVEGLLKEDPEERLKLPELIALLRNRTQEKKTN
eukprot:TRINITY_DN3394_c0_g1_i2.p1 TRINITY_DN3394_c0_g1~~TRINITY_DN3394_c0_g1_i2.p1  ORF type:complete len:542 (-),score=35.68 TRINITY_DN3394_c0_g1_i2:63-1688(-)